MSTSKSIRWSDSDPRDIEAKWGEFSLRVRAERGGTVWVTYVTGPDTDIKSEHVSKDAAKQRAARIVREAAEKLNTP